MNLSKALSFWNQTIRLEIELQSGLFIGKHGQTLEAIQHQWWRWWWNELESFLSLMLKIIVFVGKNLWNQSTQTYKHEKKSDPIGVEPMNAIGSSYCACCSQGRTRSWNQKYRWRRKPSRVDLSQRVINNVEETADVVIITTIDMAAPNKKR